MRRHAAQQVHFIGIGHGDQQIGVFYAGIHKGHHSGAVSLHAQNIILFHNGLQHLRVAVHNSKIVVIFGSQLLCQGVANLAKPCNDNFHASSSCTFCLLAQGRRSILKIHRTFKKI